MIPLGIYLHIPFCIKKCLYCDFNSVELKQRKEIDQYIAALKEEIYFCSKDVFSRTVKSIYFGGGTPSLLTEEDVNCLVAAIKEKFSLLPEAEITLEANPATICYEQLLGYKNAGINRISLGVQSFQDKYLKILGRIHTGKDALESIELLRRAGFSNISIDLMYGLPGQDLKGWTDDLARFISLGLEHISFYDLKIEKNTPFYPMRDELFLPKDELQIDMYKRGIEKLKKAGYRHYEISSFAKEGKESKHNLVYWENKEYLGIGAGAYSYLKGTRFRRHKSINTYLEEAAKTDFKGYDQENLDIGRSIRETIALNLRILDGVSLTKIAKERGITIDNGLLDRFNHLQAQGLIDIEGEQYRLTQRGILFYDTVAGEILVLD
ncbi:MAG: radical SAM family heme chaperone HemW [PVC group bacterium]|nr:radical SAM family heme chaperone HemW [PVC group bacterium]